MVYNESIGVPDLGSMLEALGLMEAALSWIGSGMNASVSPRKARTPVLASGD